MAPTPHQGTGDESARESGDEPVNRSRAVLTDTRKVRSWSTVFISGAVIGVLGGMIGLGGAEFRLPVLNGLFGFVALQAVILNKAMSLIVVLTALPGVRRPTWRRFLVGCLSPL